MDIKCTYFIVIKAVYNKYLYRVCKSMQCITYINIYFVYNIIICLYAHVHAILIHKVKLYAGKHQSCKAIATIKASGQLSLLHQSALQLSPTFEKIYTRK